MPARSSRRGHLDARRARRHAASFTPHLLIAGGPRERVEPDADRRRADRLRRRLAAAEPARGRTRPGPGCGGWRASRPRGTSATTRRRRRCTTRRPGRTFDGVARDGTINRNSGAESTIHGLLSMLALDAAPDVAAQARHALPLGSAPRGAWSRPSGDARRRRDRRHARPTPGPARARGAAAPTSIGGTRQLRRPTASSQPVALRTADSSGGSSHWGPLGTLSHADAGAAGRVGDPGLDRDRRRSPAPRAAA